MEIVQRILTALAIQLIHGISAAQLHLTAVIIYAAVNLVFFVFFLIMITFCTCKKCFGRENKDLLDDTYIHFNTVDSDVKSKERTSRYSMDTEHEFSYYDNISNNQRPASEVATMKLLGY
ncbi:hypothetical protein Zmor_009694 [Zophobas morio]|uniref:Uncharacterized protein n=1 Tax=Zophobas morio TaxID=2755281 RepID=A0AA38IMN8_9CUCU|nr:hypothetical protein Zmor_009694 [Zophobas morio]